MSDSNLGDNFNKEELNNNLLGLPSVNFDQYSFDTSEYVPEGFLDFGEPLNLGEPFKFETNYWNSTTLTEEIIKEQEEKSENTNESGDGSTKITYRDPLRKIAGGRVLQYPIDLDTDIQDYFEIQVFKYRPAGSLPSIESNNQGSNPAGVSPISGSYYSGSNRRGNRQNFRLQDLQSTIQLPMPPSIKDTNSVDFGGGNMSGFAAALFGPVVASFLNKGGSGDLNQEMVNTDTGILQGIRNRAQSILTGGVGTLKKVLGAGFDALENKEFTRFSSLNAIAQAVAALGVNIDVNQAITRTSGAVRNPNLELLFKGPALRSFSFTIRLTPRSPEESKRVRMIIRVLKQHSAVKRNARVFNSSSNSNFLIGTPDVFKLRYIKARTQKDIKGLNKFKTCALNSVSVDYTGEVGRFAAYEEDSQPVTTIISLSFTELTPLYDEDYAEFTSDDDVGL
tara:strand:- start:33 stop:1385 length:1353 start_codon:yes stop_codon:yes gene_type:complete